ncbi:MAG TPA: cation:proton antiporter [Rhodothermales bacterium]|nr:cation:proton antiporter [Rhodothermales bacterium]
MTEHILVGIVSVIVLGISAQWIAWRFKMPSILLLLIFGFVAGPITGWLPPSSLQGDWLFAFVSLSIGVILFEGGLSLRLSELREVGKAVFNLITIGVLVTWALVGLAAYYIAGFNLGLSILIGAILTVTGPTVVIPLLRHVRPSGRVGAVAKWEGITIDPVGAILAVLVLETILLLNQTGETGSVGEAAFHAVEGLLLTIFISVGISVIGATLLILLLYRRLVPDYLQNAVALMIVVGTFALSNVLQEESGLLEVTLMGIIMANQKWVPVRRIMEFKENLQVLLIASLFILLSARLELSALDYIDTNALIFLGVLILVIRPIAVAISSLGTRLEWREQAFLAWLAPRGIVAAAVASLFAFRLQPIYPSEAGALVPIVFLVIVGTVAVYGLTISPLARYLKLAHPNPQGVLFLGAHPWAQQIAVALHKLEFKVLVIDSNTKNIEQARRKGLPAEVANALSESTVDDLDLGGIGRFIALTPNDEINSLAALNFTEVFESTSVFQLAARPESRQEQGEELPQHLRGRPLFGESTTFATFNDRFRSGGEVATLELTEEFTYSALQSRYDDGAVLLFVVRGSDLLVHSEEGQIEPAVGDTVVVFLPPRISTQARINEADFEQLIARSFVMDLANRQPFDDIATEVAALVARQLPITSARLARGFIEGVRYGAVPITHGLALPHYRVSNLEAPELVLVRCRNGLLIQRDEEGEAAPEGPVYALFFLVSPEENPGTHLRTLANLASRIDTDDFMERWLAAEDGQRLRETLLNPERYVAFTLEKDSRTAPLIGQQVADLDLPSGSMVALMQRNGEITKPGHSLKMQAGDRLTITGDAGEIGDLRERYDGKA